MATKGSIPSVRSPGTFPVNDRQFVIASLTIVAVAVFLRLYHLGLEELWKDESISANMLTETDWTSFLGSHTPPLYYLLLKCWSFVAGNSEFGLRALSALLGSLSVLATIWMGKTVLSASVGLWSGLFVAVNPMAIYYSQEARAYALLLLFLVLAYTTLWRALEKGTWKHWALFSLCALLALYSHYLAVLALVPTAVLVLLWPTQGRKDHRWLCYWCAVVSCAVLFFPVAAFKFLSACQGGSIAWLETVWRQSSPWLLIPHSLEVFGLGPQSGLTLIRLKQWTSVDFPVWLHFIGVSMLVLLVVAALVPQGDFTLGVPWIRRRKIWLVTLVCVPLFLLLGISFVRPLYLVGRYDLIGFPGYAVLLGLGAAKLQHMDRFGPWILLSVVMCLLGVIGTKLFLYYHSFTPPRWANARVTASYLDANVKNGDVVVLTELRGAPVRYYLSRLGYQWRSGRCVDETDGRDFGCRMFPLETKSDVGTCEPEPVRNSRTQVRSDVSSYLEDLGDSDSLWIVAGVRQKRSQILSVSHVDSFLLTELKNLGYALRYPHGAPPILHSVKP